jgi:ABC-type Fe3+-hydroxamate transport system substrate-binding protein/adenosylcobinamide amidohydrolase
MKNSCCIWGLILAFVLAAAAPVCADPLVFVDDQGRRIVIAEPPHRVVSLVPAVTEILFRIGAADAVVGVTYHSTIPSGINQKQRVGGFRAPSIVKIKTIQPDVIFYAQLQKAVVDEFRDSGVQLVNLEIRSMADSFRHIRLLGDIFERAPAARGLVAEIRQQLSVVAQKVAQIEPENRRRVIRLMGGGTFMTPGDDSFQNEMVRAAGGVPPQLGKSGAVVPVTLEEWLRFNPQIIYGCETDKQTAARLIDTPDWREVAAVKNGNIFFFPCDLTCRAATHTGDFIAWLSARIYAEAYAESGRQVIADKVVSTHPVDLALPYVRKAEVINSYILDFMNKTLMVRFSEPMTVLSTLEGFRDGITSVGNHFAPPPCWQIEHVLGLTAFVGRISQVVDSPSEKLSLLLTGADMTHLSIQRQVFNTLTVHALVTAGVTSNAMRMSQDSGLFYEPGTINVILLTNMQLTPRAMSRAVITATEAKTAALADMDVRSSYRPRQFQATGTGTDNMVVVQGRGPRLNLSGGHTKLGELIAKAVYSGVQAAVAGQNGLTVERSIFQRLQERRIRLFDLLEMTVCRTDPHCDRWAAELESLLMDPYYAGFVKTGLAVSDDYECGLIDNLEAFDAWCSAVAERIAEKPLPAMQNMVTQNLPPVQAKTLNALLNGLVQRSAALTHRVE